MCRVCRGRSIQNHCQSPPARAILRGTSTFSATPTPPCLLLAPSGSWVARRPCCHASLARRTAPTPIPRNPSAAATRPLTRTPLTTLMRSLDPASLPPPPTLLSPSLLRPGLWRCFSLGCEYSWRGRDCGPSPALHRAPLDSSRARGRPMSRLPPVHDEPPRLPHHASHHASPAILHGRGGASPLRTARASAPLGASVLEFPPRFESYSYSYSYSCSYSQRHAHCHAHSHFQLLPLLPCCGA